MRGGGYAMTRLILVGRVLGAFGVRGEIRVETYTDDPKAPVRYRDLLHEDGKPALTLLSGRATPKGLLARAAGVDDKDAADALRGLKLYVPRESLPDLDDEDEVYLTDLIGLAVRTPEGQALGRVKAVQNWGAGDILEVEPPTGASFYLPFTRACVPEIRLGEGLLIAVPPAEDQADDAPEDSET